MEALLVLGLLGLGIRCLLKSSRPERERLSAAANAQPVRHVPTAVRQAVMRRDRRTCRYCGRRPRRLHIDHVVPHSRGGPSDIDNLVVACRRCNLGKGARTPEEAGLMLR